MPGIFLLLQLKGLDGAFVTTLEQATLLFLVMIFLAAEVFRIARGTRGVLLSLTDPSHDLASATLITATVKLPDGTVIDAGLNYCTACMGRLRVGDEVRVTNSREGYILDLPWFQRRASHKQPCTFCECKLSEASENFR
jgi:hypothetical protein